MIAVIAPQRIVSANAYANIKPATVSTGAIADIKIVAEVVRAETGTNEEATI